MLTEKQIDAKIAKLQKQKKKIRKKKMWTCPACKRRTSIAKIDIVQNFWYVEPYG